MARVHYGRYFSERYDLGLVYPLDRNEYVRDLFDWVFEDEIESEGVFIVSHRVTGSYRYVVLYRVPVYRVLIDFTGEILECSSLKAVYRHALTHVKDCFRDIPELDTLTIRFEYGEYSDYEYLNSCGYMQRDIVNRKQLFDLTVYAGTYDVERG